MSKFLVPSPLRMLFFVAGLVIWLGIWHTGFAVASWILYLPAIFLVFAGVTGLCPGLVFLNRIFGGIKENIP